MPLNLLKRYPDLLDFKGLDDNAILKSLLGVFDRDITNNEHFCFRGKRIYPIKTDGEADMGREFNHLTRKEIEVHDESGNYKQRVFDKFRAERLHWIRVHIEEQVKDSEIHVFSVQERNQRKRADVVRTYIYNKTRKYVVVLEPQAKNGGAYYLLTAYFLDQEYGENMILKKKAHALPEVL